MQLSSILITLLIFGVVMTSRQPAARAAEPKAGKSGMALVIIDMQNDYFPGGSFELEGADAAAANAKMALERFRKNGAPVIHVRHEALKPGATFFLPGTPGAEINGMVKPIAGEPVVLKHYPNSFRETELKTALDSLGVRKLVVAGMMTLMCVDATVRAAADLGYEVVVLHDACAARALRFEGQDIPARQVHGAFLAAMGMSYAKMMSTREFLEQNRG